MRYFAAQYFAMELIVLLPVKLAALVPILAFTLPYTIWNLFEGSLLYSLRRDSSVIKKASGAWAWRGHWRQFWFGPRYDTAKRLTEPN